MTELCHHTIGSNLLSVENTHFAVQQLYQRMVWRGQLALMWSTLTRRPRRLFSLAEVVSASSIGDCKYVGRQSVLIHHIRGSEGRCSDFDTDFYPLNLYNGERWQRIALARRKGATLPPVKLILVGSVYFVRDGHHRISVAKALGQKEIDATVIVWDVV